MSNWGVANHKISHKFILPSKINLISQFWNNERNPVIYSRYHISPFSLATCDSAKLILVFSSTLFSVKILSWRRRELLPFLMSKLKLLKTLMSALNFLPISINALLFSRIKTAMTVPFLKMQQLKNIEGKVDFVSFLRVKAP